jgi:PAS domain S-box-containing protein
MTVNALDAAYTAGHMNTHVALSAVDSSAAAARQVSQTIALSDLIAANRQRDALYLLSERLLRAATPAQIHGAALDAIETALECDRSSILLFDDADTMQFVAWHGISDAYRAAVAGHSPWTRRDVDAVPIPVPDIERADLSHDLKKTILGEGIRATAFIPLVSEGQVVGKFMAYFRAPHAFTQEDLAVSTIIARQLAFSIQRLRSQQALQDKQRELGEELAATQRLQALSLEMVHEIDAAVLYEKIVDAAMAIMHADFASMQRFRPHRGVNGELELLTFRGASAEMTRNLRVASNLATVSDTGIRATRSTRLMSRRGNTVGMITTYWRQPNEPAEKESRLMDILARIAADLIERNSHDEELRTREERARTLIQLLSDVPWQARADGAFEELQPAWENYTGQSWEAHAGHGWFQAIHPDDRDAARTTWATACFYAQPYEIQARLWHAASNGYRPCVIRATPIRNEDGSVREWVGACTDVRATNP